MTIEDKQKLDEATKARADAELATSWRPDGAAQARIITPADIDSVIEAIKSRYPTLPPAKLDDLRAALMGAVGSPKSNLNELTAQAMNEARKASDDAAQSTVFQTPEQRMQALWTDFDKCERDIQDEFGNLYKDGKITHDQMEYLRSERARLDTLAKDSDGRIAGEKTLAAYQKELGIGAGDHKLVNDITAQENRLEEIHKLHVEGKKEKQQEVTEANSDKHAALDMMDDEPSMPTKPSQKGKMEIAEATLNDIQSPTGGKDRSPDRTVVKT